MWVLCEAKTGYCLQFQIYTGKSETKGAEHGLSYKVVFDLLLNYLDKNFHVYFDNFYTSYKLVNDLKNTSTFSCGTIQVDQGLFPIDFKNSKLEKNKSKFLEAGNIVAIQWKDKHDVYAMSAIHGSEIELVESQNNNLVEKPRIICQYNNYMNGVDKCDQYLNYYSMGRKSIN